MGLPERKYRCAPGAHRIRRDCKGGGLGEGDGASCHDRQRKQQTEQHRNNTDLPMIWIARKSGPGELGMT